MVQQKIFLNNTPPLPAKCAACNNDFKAADAAIDFGSDLDYYGAILLCKHCVINAAALVDLVPVAKLVQTSTDLMVAQSVVSSLTQKVRALESLATVYLSDPDFSIDSLFSANFDLSLFERYTQGSNAVAASGESNERESSQSVAG